MSLFTAMSTAVAGLNAQARKMGHISDNIANVSTIAYKKITTDFSTMVTQSGHRSHTPGGVTSTPYYNISLQGQMQGSTKSTHMGVSGDGFFIVRNYPDGAETQGLNKKNFYTRKGDFNIDAKGNLVNSSGFYLMGRAYDISTDELAAGDMTTVNVANMAGIASMTKEVRIGLNVPAEDTGSGGFAGPPAVALGEATMFTEQTLYDAQGQAQTIRLEYAKDSADTWQARIIQKDSTGAWQNLTGTTGYVTLSFNQDGTLSSTTPPDSDDNFNWNGTRYEFTPPTAAPITWAWPSSSPVIEFNIGTLDKPQGITQFSSEFSVTDLSQDGLPYGQFAGVNIDEFGDVYAQYGNGATIRIYHLPLAVFSNADGMQLVDGNAYEATVFSGDPSILSPGVGRSGKIISEALEGSSVDIAEEFTQMIQTQRAYSANSRVITAADQMTDEIIRIAR